ncbi:MAG: FtsX-like permease family protein [Caldithrix sp.]|nr:MAG: FtsX-like permease family protein [Caldithrix sp.]
MIVGENMLVALQSLKANPLRSILTLLGIGVGIGAVLYVVVLGEITQRSINERLEALGSNVLTIRPGFSRRGHVRTAASVVNLKMKDADEILYTSAVITHVVPTYSGTRTVEFRDKNTNSKITGTLPEYQVMNNEKIVAGRFFTHDELQERARVCVLGATVHEEVFENASPIGESILINSKRFQVIGLLGAKGESWGDPDNQVFIPLTTAQERLFGVDHLSSILAQMRSPEDYDEALFDIENMLRRNHRLRPEQENDFRVRRQDFYLSTIQDTNKEIGEFIIVIALVSLLVGGIGIANVMLVSVTERIREIGIRRAIGAKKIYIILQFLTEAVLLGTFGGLLGIVGGSIFNHFNIGEELILPWVWIGYSFMICAGIGIVAGLYPAFRAANANVIDALRYE